MDRKGINMRLSEIELAQVEVLRHGISREQWFRNMIRASSEQRAAIHEAAISAFAQAGPAHGQTAANLAELIAEYEAELAILRRRDG